MKVVEFSRCVVPILSMRLKNVPESLISVLLAPARGRAVTRLLGVLSVLQPKTGKTQKEKVKNCMLGRRVVSKESGQ